MTIPGQVRGGSGGWPVLVRCEIGRSWKLGLDSHVPGVLAVRDGLPLTDLVIAQIAQTIATQSSAARDLRNSFWVDARVLLVDVDAQTERLRGFLARRGDIDWVGVSLTENIAALHALRTWVLTLAGGAVDELPTGQTRDTGEWRYARDGHPITLPTPMTSVHTRAGVRGRVVDAWIDLDRSLAVVLIDTPGGIVRQIEPVTGIGVPVRDLEDRVGVVHHDTTSRDMRTEITVLLDEAGDGLDVDVDALVAQLIARHGPIHPEKVPWWEFWALVAANVRPEAT